MASSGLNDDLLDLFKDYEHPCAGDYWWIPERWKTRHLLYLIKSDYQEFPADPSCPGKHFGWIVRVVRNGKELFWPNRLLGRKACEMEVIAWMIE